MKSNSQIKTEVNRIMTKQEAIEIITEALKGKCLKEDFFKLPNEIISETLDKYAESVNNSTT